MANFKHETYIRGGFSPPDRIEVFAYLDASRVRSSIMSVISIYSSHIFRGESLLRTRPVSQSVTQSVTQVLEVLHSRSINNTI